MTDRALWLTVGVLAGILVLTRSTAAAAANGDDIGPDDMNSNGITPAMRDLALAIARAEGFGVPGSIPQRANNPGDLVIPGWTGARMGDQGISVFNSPADGWGRLYHQLALIGSGKSHVYSSADTFADFGAKWTQTQSLDWTNNVIEYLNSKGYAIDDETTLGDFLALS